MTVFHITPSSQSVIGLLGLLISATLLYPAGVALYNAFLHPLSRIPEPRIAGASRIPWASKIRSGTLAGYVKTLHEKYGEVVRVAPKKLSLISGETAWQEIYGLRGGKHNTGTYLKDPMFFPLPPNGVDSIIVASEADHSRQRRLVAHAFTDKASKQQEPIIQSYVNLLIQRLHEQVQGESHGKVDMVKWYNYTTFDVVADSTFGDSFHCLRDKDYNPWVPMAFQTMKSFGLISINATFLFGRKS